MLRPLDQVADPAGIASVSPVVHNPYAVVTSASDTLAAVCVVPHAHPASARIAMIANNRFIIPLRSNLSKTGILL
jgi:hypothetical protein